MNLFGLTERRIYKDLLGGGRRRENMNENDGYWRWVQLSCFPKSQIMCLLKSSLFTSLCYEPGNNFRIALLRMYLHSWLLSQLLLLKKKKFEGGQKEWPWKIAQWIKVFASEAWGLELGSLRVHTKGEQARHPLGIPLLGKQAQRSWGWAIQLDSLEWLSFASRERFYFRE